MQVDHAQRAYWDEYYRGLGERGSDLDWGGRWTAPPPPAPGGRRQGRPRARLPPGRMVMLYPLSRTGAARALFYYTSQPNGTDRLDARQQKQLVADRFAGVGWMVPRTLEATWAADDFYTDRASKVVGDSAFAGSVGMGTSMALVSAYVLAGELAATGGDHRQAFARYEQAMRPFVERNVKPPAGSASGPSCRRPASTSSCATSSCALFPGSSSGQDRR